MAKRRPERDGPELPKYVLNERSWRDLRNPQMILQICHPAIALVHEVTRPTSIAPRPHKTTFYAGFKTWSRPPAQVAESQVAGYGVFARCLIQRGTVVGGYPGLPRTAKSMLAKATRVPQCQQYVFQISSNLWLDPTDSNGYPSPNLISFMPFLATDISMAYVNEPPTGQTVNIEFVDAASSKNPDLQFVAIQDINLGQELFIDYGNVYNRSGYSTKL